MSPYKDKEKAKEASKERMRRYREGVTKEGVTEQGVTRLFAPSKFLTEEQDLIIEQNVRNAIKLMAGERLRQFQGLSNSFVPNILKDPMLKVPRDAVK